MQNRSYGFFGLCKRIAVHTWVLMHTSYPNWIESRLTPNFEKVRSVEGYVPSLHCFSDQIDNKKLSGHDVYAELIESGTLPLCGSLADAVYYAKYPDKIPAEWQGQWVCFFASVVQDREEYQKKAFRYVPYLFCIDGKAIFGWIDLDDKWNANHCACVYKSE